MLHKSRNGSKLFLLLPRLLVYQKAWISFPTPHAHAVSFLAQFWLSVVHAEWNSSSTTNSGLSSWMPMPLDVEVQLKRARLYVDSKQVLLPLNRGRRSQRRYRYFYSGRCLHCAGSERLPLWYRFRGAQRLRAWVLPRALFLSGLPSLTPGGRPLSGHVKPKCVMNSGTALYK